MATLAVVLGPQATREWLADVTVLLIVFAVVNVAVLVLRREAVADEEATREPSARRPPYR